VSQDVMVALAKEVSRDWQAQQRIEALLDDELARMGLDDQEIRAIRDGFFDRVLMLGLSPDDQSPGCCFG
jgi:hypothetical protein